MPNSEKSPTVSVNLQVFLIPFAVIIAGVIIASAIYFKDKSAASPDPNAAGAVAGQENAPAPSPNQPTPPPAPTTAVTSIDDDAVLGNKATATVAIVEFSDYECPFCKRFWEDAYTQIKKDYVDTGKAILVFRDLALSFHDPAASREAMAAECARSQGGDAKYYELHDKIFETTAGNGQGVDLSTLGQLAQSIGLNGEQLKSCISSNEFQDEIDADATEASKIGINGTPGFVVGKLSPDGTVEGVIVRGAQPYSVFKDAIESQI